MKRLLSITGLLLIVYTVIAQNDPVDTTQIVVKTGATHSTPALIHLPNDYTTSSTSYPLIIFCHGSGQNGGPAVALYTNQEAGGPAYYIAHGQWPSSFTNPKDGQSSKFIVVSPWLTAGAGTSTTGSATAGMVDTIIADLISRYRVDPSRIYLTGLSAGGQAVVNYIGNMNDANSSPIPTRYRIAAAVPMSAQFNGSHEKSIADSTFAHKTGLWGIGSPSDVHGANTLNIIYYINLDSAGYAQSTSYTGGHCCWGQFYLPTFKQAWRGDTISIYQFMLEYKAVTSIPLIANAGRDQTIQLPTDSVLLDAGASTGGVTGYAWSLISGPSTPAIVTPATVTTRVRGLSKAGVYSFKLTVSNASGSVAYDTVLINVAAAATGQYDPVDTMQITVKTGATHSTPALIHLPNDYATTSTSYPLVIFCPGIYQSGGSAFSLYSDSNSGGPAYFIARGQWPSSFTNPKDGQSYKFIMVSPLYTASAGYSPSGSVSAAMVDTIIRDLISRYRVDSSHIYLTGLDAGGQAVVSYIGNSSNDNSAPIPTHYKIAAAVPMSAVFAGSHAKAIADSTFAHKTGLWGIGDPTETHGANTLNILYYINLDSSGYAQRTQYSQGHCCWGQFYNPAFKQAWRGDSVSIYQFLLEYKAAIPIPVSCHGVRRSMAITANDQGRYITMQNTTMNPGDTLVVNSAHRWSYLSGDGIHGTASCPIVIMNDTGQVEMTAGMSFSNSTYLHITGTGSANHFYGFYIHSYDSIAPVSRGNSLQVSQRSAFVEVDHIDEYLRTYCMWVKDEAECPDSLRYPNWHIDNISIHDIRAKNINQDGFYLGSTSPNGQRAITCNGVTVSPIPLRLSNIHVYNILLDSVGRTGIQLSGADSGVNEINNCRVTRTGFEFNPSQGSGIILGGYTHASVHDNYVRSTFQHGIFCIGAGLQSVYNNDIDSSGYLQRTPTDTVTINIGYCSINADTRLTTNQGATPNGIKSTVVIRNNKVGLSANHDPSTGTSYNIVVGTGYTNYPTWDSNNVICNNVLQNGSTPAALQVNSNIVYTTTCSGSAGTVQAVVKAVPANVLSIPGLTLTNYPNPFTGNTTVSLTLPKAASVVLKVHNIMGNTVTVLANGRMQAGSYNYSQFGAGRLPAGVYVLQLIVDGQQCSRLMLKQ